MNSYSIFIERLFLHPFFKINLKKIANCFPTELFFVNLYKEYSYLILNELEGLPYLGVMIWQPFMLLRSASLCLFRITLIFANVVKK